MWSAEASHEAGCHLQPLLEPGRWKGNGTVFVNSKTITQMFSPALLAFHNLGSQTRSVLLKKSFWEQFWDQNEAEGTGIPTPRCCPCSTPQQWGCLLRLSAWCGHIDTPSAHWFSPQTATMAGARNQQRHLGLPVGTEVCSLVWVRHMDDDVFPSAQFDPGLYIFPQPLLSPPQPSALPAPDHLPREPCSR